jgi:glycosyltransferase involved in cell wall biosynthesis
MKHRGLDGDQRGMAGMAGEMTKTGVRRVVISSFDSSGNRHYNGGGVAVVEMIAARLAANFEVTVLTAGRLGRTEVRDGVRHVQLPVGWAGPRAGQLLFHALLPFAVRRIRHDLWIENFTPPFSTSCLPLFTRAPVLGFAQALTGKELSARYGLPFSVIERWGLRLYRDVVVLNPADRDLVRDSSPAARVRVIPNGIQKTTLDQRLLGRGEHILFLGRIDVWKKGLDVLLAAYEMSGLTMPLVIAGSGLPREERKLATLLSTTKSNARWVGRVVGQVKQDLLERSAFIVMPSRHEAFGLVALEGMSCGKPVVHFDLPTLRWMGEDLRVPPYDVSALAAQMRQLADDAGKRQELGLRAHAVAQTYSRDETADRYFELVQELLGNPVTGIRART